VGYAAMDALTRRIVARIERRRHPQPAIAGPSSSVSG